MKLSVIYHSVSGNTKRIAEFISEGAQAVEGTEVQTMSIGRIDEEFVQQSNAVIIGFPTYNGSCSWNIKKWIDTIKIDLAGKLGAVFVTENYLGGGADFAEIVIIGALLVHGMLIYSAGGSRGQPFTHFGPVNIKDGDDFQQNRSKLFGSRIALKAIELWGI